MLSFLSSLCFARVSMMVFLRSNTGLVNVYGSDSFLPSVSVASSLSWSGLSPKPVKTIENLTTPISTLRFNHDAQVLAIASKEKKDSMRLVSGVLVVLQRKFCLLFRRFTCPHSHLFPIGPRQVPLWVTSPPWTFPRAVNTWPSVIRVVESYYIT